MSKPEGKDRESRCPFARIGQQAFALAQAIDPATTDRTLADVMTALLAAGPGMLGEARPQDLEQLFDSIDLNPFRSQPLTESEIGGGD